MDYREKLLGEIQVFLETLDVDDMDRATNGIIKILSGYDVDKRCTDLALLDDGNDKLIKQYAACLSIDGKSKKTIYQYRRTCKLLSNAIGKPFTEMGPYDIRYFLATEKERGISNRSLENTRSYISAFFQWMTNEEIIQKNPVARITSIKYPEENRKPFSDLEVDALRGACITEKERAIVEVLLSTGVRVSELTSMMVKDIDYQTLAVHVVHGKGSKERYTYITPVALKHLKKYISSRTEEGGHLFYNAKHDPLEPGGIRYILNELGKRAGVENVHPHRFRRTFATGLANRGMKVQDIQILLGHSRIETTMTYIHQDAQKVQAEYNRYIG